MYDRLRTRLDSGRQDGFTLIELLIVVVILGVLAGIVVFAVGNSRGESVTAACKADKKTVATAAEAYKARKGNYPSQAELTSSPDGTLKSFPGATVANEGYAITYSVSGPGVLTVGPTNCP